MQEQILSEVTRLRKEITELRKAFTYLIGTIDLPKSKQFSIEALRKAAKEFKKLSSLSNQWIRQSELSTYFPDCGDGLGKFIREELEFSNYYKDGVVLFYNRKDIEALAKELDSRNVDLSMYMKLKKEKTELRNRVQDAMLISKAKGKKKSYKLADGLKDVKISDYNLPDKEVLTQQIEHLMQKFEANKLGRYINIFGDFAMEKYGSRMKDYVPEEARKLCRSWCNQFNKAHNALQLMSEHEQKVLSREK